MRELTEQEMTEIYQSHLVEDFPAGEVKPLAHMLEGRKKGQYEAYGLFEKDTLKGYAYFIKNSTQPAALLDYFAIVRGLRSAGYGSLFLKKLQAMCIEQQKQLILEVENPDSDSFSFQNAASTGYSYPTSPVGKIRTFSLHLSFCLPHQEHRPLLPDCHTTESGGRIHRIPPCPTRSL